MTRPALASPAAGAGDLRVIAVVGVAHGLSHFFQLIIAPLFPWLKDAFALSYSELGLLMSVFFVVSGVGQALSGFLVDRVGPVPVMVGSIGLFAGAAAVLAISPSYAALMLGAALAGLGNASFHPVDYSILNSRISSDRIGHAYAMHGVSGSIGWALAPLFLIGIAQWAGWRQALASASVLALAVLLLVWTNRDALRMAPRLVAEAGGAAGTPAAAPPGTGGVLDFLKLPAIWLSFAFFFAGSLALSGVQSFGTEAARQLHAVPMSWAAWCLTAYMLASACGTVAGGFLAGRTQRAEQVIGICFTLAAALALSVAFVPWPGWIVPVLFALMGVAAGIAYPARDMLIRGATPPGATGRVYGIVYSGMDTGMAVAPFIYGLLMDLHSPALVWVGIAVAQVAMIVGALGTGRAARSQHGHAAAQAL
ncbi:MAG: MFS transporter [Burkholderiaceae bacterium]